MLNNKIVLLTGATDGIGKETAFMLAKEGAILLMHGKRPEKGRAICREIINKTGNKNVSYLNADFCYYNQIIAMSDAIHKQFPRIDIIVNNAGIYEEERIIPDKGPEKTFMVNYLAPFGLSLKLMDLIKKSDAARIINLSSMIHATSIDFDNLNGEKFYNGDNAYSLSKLCNILFTNKLSRELKNFNITVNSMHPGVINTKLLKAGWGAIGDDPIEGAKRIYYLANAEELAGISGMYFMNNNITPSAAISYDESIQDRLWNLSQAMINKLS